MDKQQLSELVLKARQGRHDALESIFKLHYNHVYFLAVKMVGNHDDALDIVQDTFTAVFQNIRSLKEAKAFRSWLFRITVNKCKKHFENKKGYISLNEVEGLSEISDDDEEFLPQSVLDKAETRSMIMSLIDNLPDEQRVCILLYYYEGLKVEEIAAVLDCPINTVKSRLFYARKQIKEGLNLYEQKGDKLYGATAIPVLTRLLEVTAGEDEITLKASDDILNGILKNPVIHETPAAGENILAKLMVLPVKTKIIAGLVAGSMAAAGIATPMVIHNTSDSDAVAKTTQEESLKESVNTEVEKKQGDTPKIEVTEKENDGTGISLLKESEKNIKVSTAAEEKEAGSGSGQQFDKETAETTACKEDELLLVENSVWERAVIPHLLDDNKNRFPGIVFNAPADTRIFAPFDGTALVGYGNLAGDEKVKMLFIVPFLGELMLTDISKIDLPYLQIIAHDIEFDGGFQSFFQKDDHMAMVTSEQQLLKELIVENANIAVLCGNMPQRLFGNPQDKPRRFFERLMEAGKRDLYCAVVNEDRLSQIDYRLQEQSRDELFSVKVNGKWGFIDQNGELAIQPFINWGNKGHLGTEFSEGRAVVWWGNPENPDEIRDGYIDRTGDFVIEPKYSMGYNFKNGFARVITKGGWNFIDKNGNVLLEESVSGAGDFSEGLAPVLFRDQNVFEDGIWKTINGRTGYIDTGGQLAIDAVFDGGCEFSEGLACITINEKFGFIDKSGSIVIEPVYEYASSFSEGLAYVKLDGKYGYIDSSGNMVIEPQYDCAYDFSEGLACVRNMHDTGTRFLNAKGEVVIDAAVEAHPFSEALSCFRHKGKYGFMDKHGKVIVKPVYDYADSYKNGLALVGIGDFSKETKLFTGRIGYVDRTGRVVWEPAE